jgi:hypothetical protein
MIAGSRITLWGTARAVLTMLGAVVGGLGPPFLARAQGPDLGLAYITPFPERDVYRVTVIGDSLAEGLADGLQEAFSGDTSIAFAKKARGRTSLARPDTFDWGRASAGLVGKDTPHVVVVMFGVAESQQIRNGRKRVAMDSPDWRREYGLLVDSVVAPLRKANIAVYWIGVPIQRHSKAIEEGVAINNVIRERVYQAGGRFIDSWNGFADANGQFSQYGPDVAGKIRLLRDKDGIHFTGAGYGKLAHFLERELRRDISLAKAERSVPLVGTEQEQRRIRADAASRSDGADWTAPKEPASPSPGGSQARARAAAHASTKGAPPAPAVQGLKADNVRLVVTLDGDKDGQKITLDLVRPAIPAQVIAHVTRRGDPQRPTVVGESLVSETQGGLTLIGSVVTDAEGSGRSRGRVAPTSTPHYKVLVKGEAMPAKPGRADDFRWPPRDAPGG